MAVNGSPELIVILGIIEAITLSAKDRLSTANMRAVVPDSRGERWRRPSDLFQVFQIGPAQISDHVWSSCPRRAWYFDPGSHLVQSLCRSLTGSSRGGGSGRNAPRWTSTKGVTLPSWENRCPTFGGVG